MRKTAFVAVGMFLFLLSSVWGANASPENRVGYDSGGESASGLTTGTVGAEVPGSQASTSTQSEPPLARPTQPMPISEEHEDKRDKANQLIWWGVGFSVGGLVLGLGGAALTFGVDEEGPGVSLMVIGLVAILASTPVWVVGVMRRRAAVRAASRIDPLPKSQVAMDVHSLRDQARLFTATSPSPVSVFSYSFQF